MTFDPDNVVLRPLGVFASLPNSGPWTARDLDTSAPMATELRDRVATYLEGCSLIWAWMEYTRDEIGDRFGVPGGSAIYSDGTYYWRCDAVNYIREYGIPVPAEALDHFESLGWTPPVISREEELKIDARLSEMFAPTREDKGLVVFHPDGTSEPFSDSSPM